MPAAATDPAAAQRTNLLGLPRSELEAFIAQLGGKPFRARQLMNWMYKRGVDSFTQMTDLAKELRAQLAANPLHALGGSQIDVDHHPGEMTGRGVGNIRRRDAVDLTHGLQNAG